MQEVFVVTDSACDMPVELIKKYGIDIVRIPVNDGHTEYIENENLVSDELFQNMKKGVIYKTSQIGSYDLKEKLEHYVSQGKAAVFMSLSSGITGGYHAACVVKSELMEEYPDARIHICDTFCATAGQALAVLRCAMMAQDGLSFEEVVEAAEYYKMHQDHLWTVTNFEYLVRGGRLSAAKAAVGGLLNIRPIMELNKEKGLLEPVDKVRGERALISRMCEQAVKRSGGSFNPNQTVVVAYAANKILQSMLLHEVQEQLKVPRENIALWQMGCVVGSYIGPDYTGLYYLDRLRGDKYDLCLTQ